MRYGIWCKSDGPDPRFPKGEGWLLSGVGKLLEFPTKKEAEAVVKQTQTTVDVSSYLTYEVRKFS